MTRPLRVSATLLCCLVLAGCAAESGTPAASDGVPSPELTSALEDVGRLAPALESAYRGGPYPLTLEEVVASFDETGVAPPTDGNTLAGYTYDDAATEFELCVQTPSGAWATYDTAPMSLRESGETNGCPG